jgi:tetratricopeptide (TPR) repeat protein
VRAGNGHQRVVDRQVQRGQVGRVASGVVATVPARAGARSSLAIDQWMRGEYLLRRFKVRSELLEARQHFEAALAAQPDSVNALNGMAKTYRAEVLRRWMIGADRLPTLAVAAGFARRATAVDPHHSDALTTLGHTLALAGDFVAAREALDKAIALNPSNALAHRELAAAHYLAGRFDEVRPHVENSRRLNPLEADNVYQCHMILGSALFFIHRDAEAREEFRRALLASPTLINPHFTLAALEALNGRHDEARRHLAEIQRRSAGASIERSREGQFSFEPAFATAIERYYEGLRLAGLPEKSPAGSTNA